MSLVGPRPALYNQDDLIELRSEAGVQSLLPGLTGWAQIRYPYGASIADGKNKFQYDLYYVKNYSNFFDAFVLLQTADAVLFGKGAR